MAEQEAQKMINLTINGKSVQVPQGSTVFQAAAAAGIFIPHYCYHPDLSIAGVCRMCMVEVEKNPKLQISCNTPASEGMVVRADTQKVKDAVRGILELHLINHPLDCPICDKAGECKLQDFYVDYGLYKSRIDFDDNVHKPKVVDIGTIVLDSERCILCSRCVRFTAEVTQTNELGIFNRGDRSVLRTFDDGPLHNDYTGNLADICPVGALTAKDFRFRCRVWFLEKEQTVCTLCAHGCNTVASMNPTTKTLYRVEPRRNPEVNKSWICDTGRWEFHYVGDDTRLKTPQKRIASGWEDESWHNFFRDVSDDFSARPDRILVALSTSLTNEEIADSVQTLSARGVKNFMWVVDEKVVGERKPYDGLLKHRDLTANALGFETMMSALGTPWMKYAQAGERLKSGAFDWVLVLGLEGKQPPGLPELMQMIPSSTKVAAHSSNNVPALEGALYLLPNTSSYEKHGTVISALGRLAKVNGVLPWQHTARDAHAVVFGIDRGNDREEAPENRPQQVFESLVVAKILMGANEKWRSFSPFGRPLKESAATSSPTGEARA